MAIQEIQIPNAQRDIEVLMVGYVQDVPGVIQSALDQIEDFLKDSLSKMRMEAIHS